jgi:hypothetical protein
LHSATAHIGIVATAADNFILMSLLSGLSVSRTGQIRSILLGYHFPTERKRMPEPFRPLDYVLCVAAFFLVGIATVPLMTAWIR